MRTGRLPDSSLIASKIIDLTQIICASPKYLDRHGRPLAPSDLTQHRCLILNGIPEPTIWRFIVDGRPATVEIHGVVSADSSDVLLKTCNRRPGSCSFGGAGSRPRPSRRGRAGAVATRCPIKRRLSAFGPSMPPGRQRSPKVKAFLEFLQERLGSAAWRAVERA